MAVYLLSIFSVYQSVLWSPNNSLAPCHCVIGTNPLFLLPAVPNIPGRPLETGNPRACPGSPFYSPTLRGASATRPPNPPRHPHSPGRNMLPTFIFYQFTSSRARFLWMTPWAACGAPMWGCYSLADITFLLLVLLLCVTLVCPGEECCVFQGWGELN